MKRAKRLSAVGIVSMLLGCGGQSAQDLPPTDAAPSSTADPSVPAEQETPGATVSSGGGGNASGTEGSESAGSDAPVDTPDAPSDPEDDTSALQAPTLGGCRMLPADNPWNLDISSLPVHPSSEAFIDSIGRDTTLHADFGTEWQGVPIGIPFNLVNASQPSVDVTFDVEDESDSGPYPIPADAAIEGGPNGSGDRHVSVLESDGCTLYELFDARPQADGSWEASSGAVFDLSSNALRPDRYTSADAAGLPILPGLVRYDEVVERGEILHALRFTVSDSQSAYIAPATHAASNSSDADLPPMGLRLRMRADYNCTALSSEVRVICTALKRFGMFVADNGSNWFMSGAHDPRWNDGSLADLGDIPGNAFEAVTTGAVIPY